jgi:hypothetical protein
VAADPGLLADRQPAKHGDFHDGICALMALTDDVDALIEITIVLPSRPGLIAWPRIGRLWMMVVRGDAELGAGFHISVRYSERGRALLASRAG